MIGFFVAFQLPNYMSEAFFYWFILCIHVVSQIIKNKQTNKQTNKIQIFKKNEQIFF